MRIKYRQGHYEPLEIEFSTGMDNNSRTSSVSVHQINGRLCVNVSGGTMELEAAKMLYSTLGFVIAALEQGEVEGE